MVLRSRAVTQCRQLIWRNDLGQSQTFPMSLKITSPGEEQHLIISSFSMISPLCPRLYLGPTSVHIPSSCRAKLKPECLGEGLSLFVSNKNPCLANTVAVLPDTPDTPETLKSPPTLKSVSPSREKHAHTHSAACCEAASISHIHIRSLDAE